MARKAPKISIEDLKAKIGAAIVKIGAEEYEPEELEDPFDRAFGYFLSESQTLRDDLGKIQFDFENWSEPTEVSEVMGWHTLDNGFSFLGCWAGGDWECPVHFILYWDGKAVRGFVPEDGNTFNVKYRTAYGSEGESKKYTTDKEFHSYMIAMFGVDYEDMLDGLDPDPTAYIDAIKGRIQVS